jgi:WD40 repeat protein
VESADAGFYSVDARSAEGVLVGEHSTQINYFYSQTWMSGPAPPPLVGISGEVDSPYRGLSAFGERDAAFFFGRETAAAYVLDRMSGHLDGAGLMVVSGVSGAGKSSLLCAGVLPRLRGTGLASAPEAASWPCLVFTPTRTPLDELAVRVASAARADAATVRQGLAADPAAFALTARQAALAKTSGPVPSPERRQRALLVVDQFEQLFTQCENEEERRAFITALHSAATTGQKPAALVVLAVRADFEAQCADYPELTTAVQDRYLVTAMTERQMRMAITEPAIRAGSRVDANLVETLLREARCRVPGSAGTAGAGVLPLLSHALDQAWRSREGDGLSLADYERAGGIEGAVAGSAQRAYNRLSPSQQAVARQVFVRLTATTAGAVDTADRVARTDLTDGRSDDGVRDVAAVLESFAAERLITLAADTVEISHEVLLTAWPLLHDTWLTENHADRIVRTRLRATAAEWARRSRDPSYLYRGSLLQDAAVTVGRIAASPARHLPLNEAERGFIQASNRAHRRRRQAGRALVAALGVLAIAFATAAAVAVHASRDAIYQRDIAIADQVANESETLGDADPAVSVLESVTAWRIGHTAQAGYGMLAAAARPGIAVLPVPGGANGYVWSVAFSPDGRTLAVGSGAVADNGEEDGALRLWDVATHQPIGPPILDSTAQVMSVAFSPDGRTLAARTDDGIVRFWDVATRHETGQLRTGPDQLVRPRLFGSTSSLSFSLDGKVLVTGSATGTVQLWDVATRRPLGAPLTGPGDPAGPVAFNPDGRILAAGGRSSRVRLWDVATRQPLDGLGADGGDAIESVAFNRDGTLAAVSGGTVRLWDVATRRPLGAFSPGADAAVGSMAFSPDGMVLASSDLDNTVRLWDAATQQQLGAPFAASSAVDSVAFSPDGRTIASGGGGTVRLWNAATDPIGVPLDGSILLPQAVAFSADGKTLAVANFTDRVRLWSTATRRETGALPSGHHDQIRSVTFSADGKTVATGGNGGTLQLWDTATHHLIADLSNQAVSQQAFSMTFSPDGRTLAVGSENGRVSLWDVAAHRHIAELVAGSDDIDSVAFSSDEKILAVGSDRGTVRLWDMITHHQAGPPLMAAGGQVASIPGGKTLVTLDDNGTVRSWDMATHRLTGSFSTTSGGPMTLSPDGRILAAADASSKVQLWDIATGRQIGVAFTGPTFGVTSLAFSPDGRILTAADGQTLQADDGHRKVWLWRTDYLLDVLPRLCAQAGRSLTHAEWQRDVPPGPAYQPVCAGAR